MLNTAIYSIVTNTVLSAASAKLFDVMEPKKAAVVGFSFSLVCHVALRALQALMESLKNQIDKNAKTAVVLGGLTLVYFTGVYGSHWIAKKNGHEVSLKQIHRLNVINFLVSVVIVNWVKGMRIS